jgi:hypothetical protein
VPLKTMACVIQEFFGSIATLLGRMPHDSHAIFYRVDNRACCATRLISRVGDGFSRFFRYCL